MKINPVYQKELKLSVRSVKIAFTILGFNAILAFISLFVYYISFDVAMVYSEVDYSKIFIVYMMLAILEVGLVLFVVPAYTAGCIAGEREKQTLEILLTTKLSAGQIIRGKLASSISLLLFLVFSSLPILAVVFSVGGISYRHIIQLLLMIVVTAIFVGSIGICFSTIFKKTVPATVFTYGAVVFLVIGTVVITWIIFSIVMIDYNYVETGEVREGIGNGVLLLLINPAVTLASVMTRQFGSYVTFKEAITSVGVCNKFFLQYWFEISLIIQLLISAFFIFISTKLLNPLKYKRRKL